MPRSLKLCPCDILLIQWTFIINAPFLNHPVMLRLVYGDDSWCESLFIEMKNVHNASEVNNYRILGIKK